MNNLVKVSEASGKVLNYLVACAENMSFPSLKHLQYPDDAPWFLHPDGTIRSAQEIPSNAMSRHYDYTFWSPSTDWAQGGLIIDREDIQLLVGRQQHAARLAAGRPRSNGEVGLEYLTSYGPTKLIAAMRCFVTSKLGDEVEIPKELINA